MGTPIESRIFLLLVRPFSWPVSILNVSLLTLQHNTIMFNETVWIFFLTEWKFYYRGGVQMHKDASITNYTADREDGEIAAPARLRPISLNALFA